MECFIQFYAECLQSKFFMFLKDFTSGLKGLLKNFIMYFKLSNIKLNFEITLIIRQNADTKDFFSKTRKAGFSG